MNKDQAIAIRFRDGRAIQVAEAFAYADSYQGNDGYAFPVGVIWEDGFESFGKGWWFNPDYSGNNGRTGLCRIGAGAYGDMLIITRE